MSNSKRDPAYETLARLLAAGKVAATAASRADVAAAGIRLPSMVSVVDSMPADAVLICADADVTHALAATNRFGLCDRCSAPIMYRPHAVAAGTKICVRCAAALDKGNPAPRRKA